MVESWVDAFMVVPGYGGISLGLAQLAPSVEMCVGMEMKSKLPPSWPVTMPATFARGDSDGLSLALQARHPLAGLA